MSAGALARVALGLMFLSGVAAASDADIVRQIDRLRGIQPTSDKARLDELNSRMDSVWRYLGEHKKEALPVVQRELEKEVAAGAKDQFLVLDLGSYLAFEAAPGSGDAVVAALAAIDPASGVVQYNFQQLVNFTHAIAKTGDARVLPQIDRIFLPNERKLEFFRAPHYVKLDVTDLLVLLYGATGPDVEQHLLGRLEKETHPPHRHRLLAVLGMVGSERMTPALAGVLHAARDYDTIRRAGWALLTMGGPAGAEAVRTFRAEGVDDRSMEWLKRARSQLEKATYEAMLETARKLDGDAPNVSDDELRLRLRKMYENYGVDDDTNPSNVLSSGIPTSELLVELKRVRSRTYFRLTNHVFEEVMVTNHLINTLQYKAAGEAKTPKR